VVWSCYSSTVPWHEMEREICFRTKVTTPIIAPTSLHEYTNHPNLSSQIPTQAHTITSSTQTFPNTQTILQHELTLEPAQPQARPKTRKQTRHPAHNTCRDLSATQDATRRSNPAAVAAIGSYRPFGHVLEARSKTPREDLDLRPQRDTPQSPPSRHGLQ
jgi:hypothetical protein